MNPETHRSGRTVLQRKDPGGGAKPAAVRSPHARAICPAARFLAFVMILALLVVRLGSVSEKVMVIPIEDVLFDIAAISDIDKNLSAKPLVIMTKHSLDCDVPRYQPPVLVPRTSILERFAHDAISYPDDALNEIFIPPEILAYVVNLL